jgi:hypothetical protein
MISRGEGIFNFAGNLLSSKDGLFTHVIETVEYQGYDGVHENSQEEQYAISRRAQSIYP